MTPTEMTAREHLIRQELKRMSETLADIAQANFDSDRFRQHALSNLELIVRNLMQVSVSIALLLSQKEGDRHD